FVDVERLCPFTGGFGGDSRGRHRRLGECVHGQEQGRERLRYRHESTASHLRHLRLFVSHTSDANRAMVLSSETSRKYRIGVTAMPLIKYSTRLPCMTIH